MAIVKKSEQVTVTKERTVRVSDFSGQEMPTMHWSAVTNIWCTASDHGTKNGNKLDVFDLDLMPEEMDAFRKDLGELIQKHKARAKTRLVPVPS